MITIRKWIYFACERNSVLELAQVIVVEWNRRFTCRLGDAYYSPISMRARIRLSVPLWPRASTEVRMETVVHETCHVIVGFKHGFVSRPHGAEWKQAMQNCGLKPLRLHNIDRTGLARRQKRFVLCDCPNEQKCRILVREFNMVRQGTDFWCINCGLHLHQHSSIEEDREVQKSTGSLAARGANGRGCRG
jgi:SprT protein